MMTKAHLLFLKESYANVDDHLPTNTSKTKTFFLNMLYFVTTRYAYKKTKKKKMPYIGLNDTILWVVTQRKRNMSV